MFRTVDMHVPSANVRILLYICYNACIVEFTSMVQLAEFTVHFLRYNLIPVTPILICIVCYTHTLHITNFKVNSIGISRCFDILLCVYMCLHNTNEGCHTLWCDREKCMYMSPYKAGWHVFRVALNNEKGLFRISEQWGLVTTS